MRRNWPFSSATCKNQLAQRLGLPGTSGLERSRITANASARGGQSVWQFNPFVVRHDAMAKAEMKEVERHDASSI
jgi:hypothetical protein